MTLLRRNLARLLQPRHVAFIGGDDAAIAAKECAQFGFAGPIWTVNRHRSEMAGRRCFRDVEDLPDAPDAVFTSVPKLSMLPIMESLNRRGAGGVICFAAGYAEIGIHGRLLQAELVAQAGNMALLGPNCYGLINAAKRVALWPYLHGCRNIDRGAALISQSGMVATSLTMNSRSLDFSYVISVGNQAMLGVEDFIEALLPDLGVSAFGLYIESVRDVPKFSRLATQSAMLGKPIVAMSAGRSKTASGITAHHTGSIDADYKSFAKLFSDTGVVQVETPNQLLETLKLLSLSDAPNGSRMAAFTCSGGDAALLADCGEARGITFPQPSRAVANRLRALIPDFATVSNPLDCTTQLWGKPELAQVFRVLLEDEYDVALFVQDWPRPDIVMDKTTDLREAAQFAKAARERGLPAIICSSIFENIDGETRKALLSVGAIPMQGFGEAMTAVLQASKHSEARKRLRPEMK
jgi:acyl-CoA synthetase (NDP forming)